MLENAAHPTPATTRTTSATAPIFAGALGMRRLIARRTLPPPRPPEKGISLRIAAPYDEEEPCKQAWHANLGGSLPNCRPTPAVFLPLPCAKHAKPLCISRETAEKNSTAPPMTPSTTNPRSSPSSSMSFPRFRALIRTATPREHELAQVAIRQRSQHFPLIRETRGIISQCNYRQRPYQHTKKGRASPLLCITSYSFLQCAASWGSSSKPS